MTTNSELMVIAKSLTNIVYALIDLKEKANEKPKEKKTELDAKSESEAANRRVEE